VTVRSLEAITFDFWDTIMVAQVSDAHRLRVTACTAVFERSGHDVALEDVDYALRTAFDEYREAWEANRQFGASEVATICLETLGLPVSLHDELVDAIIADGAGRELTTAPNIGSTLAALNAAGLRVGIICDVGITGSRYLRRALERAGLLGHFAHWSFSDEVGHYKPSPLIFAHAMDGLGVSDPSRMCHIGDLRRTDVAGAKAAGWLAIRYAGLTDDPSEGPEGDIVIHDHAELPGALDGR
jgi:putative hydrolase of the HAD superfamily